MTIWLNGQSIQMQPGQTLADALSRYAGSGPFAVALNGNFISRSHYRQTPLKDDDKLEVLAPIQGG